MRKEKTIRTYQRRTKTGKIVTVKQHTAKYDAAEAMKEAAKKKGAGDELEGVKKKGELDLAKIDAYKGDPNELSDKERQAWQILTGNYPESAEKKLRKMKSLEKVWAYADAKSKKKSSTKAPKETKVSKDATDPYSAHGFTKDEFKEWYEGTGSKADKKVEKALKKAMGTKAYNALSDKAADEYKKGGAHRFFTKGLEEMKAATSDGAKKELAKAPNKDTSRFMLGNGKYISTEKALEAAKKLEASFQHDYAATQDAEYRKKENIKKASGKSLLRKLTDVQKGRAALQKGDVETAQKILQRYSAFTSAKDIGDSTNYEGYFGGYKKEPTKSPSKKETKTPKSSIGISQSDWDDVYGVGGAGTSAAMKRIDSAARKYLGAKAYNKWAKYQDDSDDTGGSYKGFLKQLEKFKEGKGDEYAKQSAKESSEHLSRSFAAQRREYPSKMSYAELKEKYTTAIHPAIDHKADARKYKKILLPLVEQRVKDGNGSKWDKKFLKEMGKSSESSKSKDSKISDSSLKAKGYVSFKDFGTTLYIGKRGKAVYMKTSKGIVKADRDDYADFVTGYNGLSKANRKKLESLGWHEHEEY